MLAIYGLVRSDLLLHANVLVEFPPFHGRTVGGVIPVDAHVSLLELSELALRSLDNWLWQPADQGYVLGIEGGQATVLKNHLRRIRQIQDEHGANRLWPWFDPRYFKMVLTTLQGPDLASFFGPIKCFAFAQAQGIDLFELEAGSLRVKGPVSC